MSFLRIDLSIKQQFAFNNVILSYWPRLDAEDWNPNCDPLRYLPDIWSMMPTMKEIVSGDRRMLSHCLKMNVHFFILRCICTRVMFLIVVLTS